MRQEEEERVGQRLEKPKLRTQNAPTRGRRRRIVVDETSFDALQQRVGAILVWVSLSIWCQMVRCLELVQLEFRV